MTLFMITEEKYAHRRFFFRDHGPSALGRGPTVPERPDSGTLNEQAKTEFRLVEVDEVAVAFGPPA